jgi:hypothetical protein
MAESTLLTSSTPEPRKPESASKYLLYSFLGGVASAAAGLLVSSQTVEWIAKHLSSQNLPKGAVIFVSNEDCGGAESGWVPLKRAQGHFIVAADNNTFKASDAHDGAGENITVKIENLPNIPFALDYRIGNLPSGQVYSGGPKFVVMVGQGSQQDGGMAQKYDVSFMGGNAPMLVRPPWMALTACEPKP